MNGLCGVKVVVGGGEIIIHLLVSITIIPILDIDYFDKNIHCYHCSVLLRKKSL